MLPNIFRSHFIVTELHIIGSFSSQSSSITYETTFAGRVYINQALQIISETIITNAASCEGIFFCISFSLIVAVDYSVFSCLYPQPFGTKCALVSDIIILSPQNVESPIALDEQGIARVKVVNVLSDAVEKGG